MTKFITVPITVAVVFAVTGVPAWAYIFPAALLAIHAAIIIRTRRIEAHR
ncbi:hypothetical protein WKY82_20435 [Gordonia malaquae]